MLNDILVPLDGSPFAAGSVRIAAGIAARHGARLHLVSVCRPLAATMLVVGAPPEALADSGDLDRLGREEMTEHLAVQRRTALATAATTAVAGARAGGLVVKTKILEGDAPVAEQLASYMEAQLVDLVVMTTHGRGTVGRLWFGSVADRLVRIADRPCLLLRAAGTDWGAGEAGPYRVLVPIDGSSEAERGIEQALALAAPVDAEILLLDVVVPIPALDELQQSAGRTFPTEGSIGAQHLRAERYVGEMTARLRSRGMRARGVTVVDPSPGAAILSWIETRHPDLVVLAGRRRSGPDRLLMGSVMDTVLRRSQVPVLVWRLATMRKAREMREERDNHDVHHPFTALANDATG